MLNTNAWHYLGYIAVTKGSETVNDGLHRIMEEIAREVAEEWSGPKRDPKRIDVILSKLREVWMQDTDMRFGQLVYNLYWLLPETKKIGMNGIDMFNVEDDVFERFLDRTVKEGWQSAEGPQA